MIEFFKLNHITAKLQQQSLSISSDLDSEVKLHPFLPHD